MPEQLLVDVPRWVEEEPGYRAHDALVEAHFLPDEHSGSALPADFPLFHGATKRVLGAAEVPQSTDDETDWTPTGTTLAAVSPQAAGGGGVEAVEEGTVEAPWSAVRDVDVEAQRGLWVDLLPYEPEDWDLADEPLTIEWGGSTVDGVWQPSWRLSLRGTETAVRPAVLEEWDGGVWRPRESLFIFSGEWFGRVHQLWIQPVADRQVFISNRADEQRGVVVTARLPATLEGPADGELGYAPWTAAPVRVGGVYRAWWTLRELTWPSAWTLETPLLRARELGYEATQVPAATLQAWLPNSEYTATATVLAFAEANPEASSGDADYEDRWVVWDETVTSAEKYGLRIEVSGPEDGGTGRSKRGVVLDRCGLAWDGTTVLRGGPAVDVLADASLGVQVTEDRSEPDWSSRLTVRLSGAASDIPAAWLRPFTRWQWIVPVDDGAGGEREVVRFDGLQTSRPVRRVMSAEGAEHHEVSVQVGTRWEQARAVLYRETDALDGLLRSEAYTRLAKQIPLKVAWTADEEALDESERPKLELHIDIEDDEPLPEARPGEKPLLLPRPGQSVLDVFRTIQEGFGRRDRLAFRDDGTGTGHSRLTIETPSATSAATIYRSTSEAAALATVVLQAVFGQVGQALLEVDEDAESFFNEVVLIGGLDAEGVRQAWYWQNPDSWQTPTFGEAPDEVDNPFYIGVRKTVVILRPELTTPEAIERAGWDLFVELHRFRQRVQAASHLLGEVLPGDTVSLDGEGEYTVRSMRTGRRRGDVSDLYRWPCRYELVRVADLSDVPDDPPEAS